MFPEYNFAHVLVIIQYDILMQFFRKCEGFH